MTRRTNGLATINADPNDWNFTRMLFNEKVGFQAFFESPTGIDGEFGIKSFYGKPGDQLYVKGENPIWLEILDIKVERLASISSADAIAEGIESAGEEPLMFYKNYDVGKDFLYDLNYGFNHGKEDHSAPVASFCTLWTSIYNRESWLKNPWVWVISFKQIQKSENNG